MKLTRTGFTVGMLLASAMAVAMPTWTSEFTSHYKVAKDSALKKANCGVCHQGTNVSKFNPYGQDLKKAMAELKVKKVSVDVFKKVEDLDSDKDGAKNSEEIKSDTHPGDAKSVPAKQ
jgi:hypothetical protein